MNGSLEPEAGPTASSGGTGRVEVPLGTPRKRRRPALSCVQCRRRKVKCDRKLPCTQCSQYSNAACIYDDPEVTARGKSSSSKTTTPHDDSSILPPIDNHGIPRSRETALFTSQSIVALPGLEHRSPSSSVPWRPAPPPEYPRSEHHVSESSVGAATPQSDTGIQELKERVRKLEEMISNSNNDGSRTTEPVPSLPRTNIPKLRGNIDKTRFFGMSHWMNTYEEVCSS